MLEQHYIAYGFKEGRASGIIDPLLYAGSNPDIARIFGTDQAQLIKHYYDYGYAEKRPLGTFNPLSYAIANPDVAAAFGTNAVALERHYIDFGIKEGRSAGTFEAVAYLLSYADLQAAGLNGAGAARHYLDYGRREGRVPVVIDDQTSHGLVPGKANAAAFDTGTDRDWYKVTLGAGGEVVANVLKPGAAIGTALSGATMTLYDAAGNIVSSHIVDGDTADHWLRFRYRPQAGQTATADFYLQVSAPGAAADYQLAVADTTATTNGSSSSSIATATGDATANILAVPIPITSYGTRLGVFYSYYDGRVNGAAGDDILLGAPGTDFFSGSAGADFIDGGDGYNVLDYTASAAAIAVDLSGRTPNRGGDAEGDRIFNIQAIFGTRLADTIIASDANGINYYGGDGDDTIIGGAGNDQITGGAGRNLLTGNGGDDRFILTVGANTLDGGAGRDEIFFDNGDANLPAIRIDLRSGLAEGGAAGLKFSSIEAVSGSAFDDVLAAAIFPREAGRQASLSGQNGNDILIDRNSVANAAYLDGGDGNDVLIGSYLVGGYGSDTFVIFREDGVNVVMDQRLYSESNTVIVDTFAHRAGTPFSISATLYDLTLKAVIDLSDLRDEGGAVLDLPTCSDT